ncbi:MAG: FHA domain-containing protein [Thiotrichales bacterium]
MPRVLLVSDSAVLAEYPLNKETIKIGRVVGNDIPIESMAVSSQHCKIVTVDGDSFLEDLGSTNGTYVNGKKVRKHALEHGDLITIGTHLLRYDINDDADGADRAPSTEQTPKPFARLKVISGRNAGRELPLAKKMTTLGEAGEHVAAIMQRNDGGLYFIHVDGGESNQLSMLNGEPVEQRKALHDHDVIEVAGIRMELLMH